MALDDALRTVGHLRDFWTCEGSLSSPPCKEGTRRFVARQVMYMSMRQMQSIPDASSGQDDPAAGTRWHRQANTEPYLCTQKTDIELLLTSCPLQSYLRGGVSAAASWRGVRGYLLKHSIKLLGWSRYASGPATASS